MKVNFNDDTIIVFLSRFFTEDLDFNNRELLEMKFRNIFMRLNSYYDININGYYEVCVYVDDNYGSILEIVKDMDYDLLLNEVDMRIVISKNDKFLYELDDIFLIDKLVYNKCNLYKYKNKFYLEIMNSIDNYELGKILECSKIVYGIVVSNILRFGNKIHIKGEVVV